MLRASAGVLGVPAALGIPAVLGVLGAGLVAVAAPVVGAPPDATSPSLVSSSARAAPVSSARATPVSPAPVPRAGPSDVATGTTGTPRATGRARAAGRWSWPLDPRPVVARRFDPPAQRWLAGHRGVDLLGSAGVAVRAPAEGVVAFAGSVAGKGVVSIDHPGGLRSTYEPVQALVTAGQSVRPLQEIGILATEGGHCAPRACLHWGARRGSDYIDPLALVGAGPVVLLPMR